MVNNLELWDKKSDQELVAMTLKDKEAFVYLLKRYEDKLRRYIRRISNFSPEETEDVLQEVFLKVYKNLNGFDADLKFSSWIYRITHNQVISSHRQHLSRPQSVEIDEQIVNKIKSEFDLQELVINSEQQNLTAGILEKMKDKYREILVLRFFEDKSYNEISDILKRPGGTVATMLREAKKEFKKLWLENNNK
ncbi:MAG: RNA polymerase sigma factor [Patescibacteria group bacterium]